MASKSFGGKGLLVVYNVNGLLWRGGGRVGAMASCVVMPIWFLLKNQLLN